MIALTARLECLLLMVRPLFPKEIKLKISEINSLDDIKKYGESSDLIQDLQKLVAPLKVEAATDEELLTVIMALKSKWVDLMSGPFISEKQEYIYYLTRLEGKQRNKALGITDKHYEDKNLAKGWKRSLAQKVAGDKGGSDEALRILLEIYEVLVDDDFEDSK